MAASATPPRIERRRRWSAEEKAALLVEVEAAGGSVSAVARRHRISESVLYNWRAALKAAATAEPTSEATAFIPLGVFGDTLTCESPTAALVRQRSQEQPALVRTAMYLERLTDVQTYANSAIGSMAKHDIAPNPQNFAIWYEYHTGQNADLRRMINVIVSNHREFDEQTLHDLYEHFFTSAREELALHGVSVRVQDTLQEVLLLVASARSDATLYGAALTDVSGQLARDVSPLATLIQRLVDDAHEMARRSERLGSRLTQSVKTIETLKQTLDDVRREAA